MARIGYRRAVNSILYRVRYYTDLELQNQLTNCHLVLDQVCLLAIHHLGIFLSDFCLWQIRVHAPEFFYVGTCSFSLALSCNVRLSNTHLCTTPVRTPCRNNRRKDDRDALYDLRKLFVAVEKSL